MFWVDKEYNFHDYELPEFLEYEMRYVCKGSAEQNYEWREFLE